MTACLYARPAEVQQTRCPCLVCHGALHASTACHETRRGSPIQQSTGSESEKGDVMIWGKPTILIGTPWSQSNGRGCKILYVVHTSARRHVQRRPTHHRCFRTLDLMWKPHVRRRRQVGPTTPPPPDGACQNDPGCICMSGLCHCHSRFDAVAPIPFPTYTLTCGRECVPRFCLGVAIDPVGSADRIEAGEACAACILLGDSCSPGKPFPLASQFDGLVVWVVCR